MPLLLVVYHGPFPRPKAFCYTNTRPIITTMPLQARTKRRKVFYGNFTRSLRKSDLKTCITALNPEIVLLDLFYLVT